MCVYAAAAAVHAHYAFAASKHCDFRCAHKWFGKSTTQQRRKPKSHKEHELTNDGQYERNRPNDYPSVAGKQPTAHHATTPHSFILYRQ